MNRVNNTLTKNQTKSECGTVVNWCSLFKKSLLKKKKDAGTVLDKRDLRETTTKMQYVD